MWQVIRHLLQSNRPIAEAVPFSPPRSGSNIVP
jgi:hypothetical protein